MKDGLDGEHFIRLGTLPVTSASGMKTGTSTGDLILNRPYRALEGNMTQYLASLERMKRHAGGFIFPAHGPPVATTQALIDTYITHHQREAAIEALSMNHRR